MLTFPAKDGQWSRKMFLLTSDNYPEADKFFRYLTTADLKYHDTSIGGNNAMNPLPQGTKYADPPIKNALTPGVSDGMGAIYSESFDDHQQVIYMRFGVPKFNSMMSFLSGMYNYKNSITARTGRSPSFMYYLSGAATTLGTIALSAAGFIIPLCLGLFALGTRLWTITGSLQGIPRSKYYYLKPTMPIYWSQVNFILNYLATNSGFRPEQQGYFDQENNDPNMPDNAFRGKRGGDTVGFTKDETLDFMSMNSSIDGILDKDGSINVLRFASRGQRRARYQEKVVADYAASNGLKDGTSGFVSFLSNLGIQNGITRLSDRENTRTIAKYLSTWEETSEGMSPLKEDAKPSDTEEVDKDSSTSFASLVSDTFYKVVDTTKNATWGSNFGKLLQTELDDGTAFIALRVDYTGAVSESFSNSSTESEIKNKINSISSSARETGFSMAGGNLADIPGIGKIASALYDKVKDSIGGAGDALGISGIAMLGGAAFVDIPKHYQDSTYSGPRFNYSITLDAIYNHPISRIIHLYTPIAMMLAASLPKATGKQSYTSPFLCELYDRGRGCTRLGMVRDLSLSRGSGNLGFMDNGIVNSFEMTFTVEDLSSVMTMPMSGLFDLDIIGSVFDEDTVFSDYMASLTGLGLQDMIYPATRIKRNFARVKKNWGKALTAEHWASWVGDLAPVRMLSMFYRGVDRM